jgi:hypothetical protein
MSDRQLEFVDNLIKEYRRAGAFFLLFAGALLVVGISSVVWPITHSGVDKLFYGATGGISSVFSGIPACFFFAARGNAIYLAFLKASWEDALAANDDSVLKKLNDELTKFRRENLAKPFWSIR